METTTSRRIISYLISAGHELTSVEKETIREILYEALSSSYQEGINSNGCDCGQPSCPRCH